MVNIDQSPHPSDLIINKWKTNESLMLKRSSGLDCRQATIQCCIFSNGVTCKRIKLLVIFRGTDQLIPLSEKVKYDSRVVVQFQQNAWCDEQVMLFWINKVETSSKPIQTNNVSRRCTQSPKYGNGKTSARSAQP